jgi:sugar (pentulose or hexulose) kinase
MALALHSRWMSVSIDAIHATGGAAANTQILQIMADVFGAEVQRFNVGNSAALGAAIRAFHAVHLHGVQPLSWDDAVAGLVCPRDSNRIMPDRHRHEMYRSLMRAYETFEARALGGPNSGVRV